MPTARTNYSDVASAKDEILPVDPSWKSRGDEAGVEPAEIPEENPDEVPRERRRGGWEISASYREGINALARTSYPLGVSYIEMSGTQAVGVRLDADLGRGDKIPTAWRASFLARYPWVGSFFREVDMGYEKQRLAPAQGGFAGGYAVGYGFSSRWAASLRGGLFWGSARQWNWELRCRFVF
jgi:hypothetical protein